MGGTPGIFHQEVAGTQAVFLHGSKTITIQRGSATCPITAEAKQEGESQAMLFAMLQEQHKKQIAVMSAANKANMDEMMERMNAMMAGSGDKRAAQQDKENTPPGRNRRPPAGSTLGPEQTKKPQKQKALCPHCKTFVLNKPDDCPELEANKGKRWPGWKSVHTIA
jgi:hypothetical protein